jgi:hypothetical protein
MPSEQKNGPFVDAASTLNKAMGSLNTDQMAAMGLLFSHMMMPSC